MPSRLVSGTSLVYSVLLMAVLCTAPTGRVRAQSADVGTEAQREAGKQLYLKYCSQCHGDKGDGEGYGTPHLMPKPRNFTTGKFKVRSTPSGALPTHQDLVNIIKRGMPYTSMPAWPNLADQEISNIAYFLTTFSADFSNAGSVPQPIQVSGAPGSSNETIEQGKKLYVETGCVKCHGNLGRGDGPSASTLKDDFGFPIRAANLSQPWTFRGGPSREDIFRTMTTGFNGTPMPSFQDALQPEQRWAITDYILSLSGGSGPAYTNLVIAKPAREPIDLAKGTAAFDSAPIARFPVVGQIMEPGRSFHPPATSVTVQAIYDRESIAMLVRWHDMSAQKTGKNAPSLPVPMEEEEAAAGPPQPAQGAQPAAADPFAEEPAPAADQPSEFSDAVAVQIPSQASTGALKPYFIFGDSQNPVDLWFFDLAQAAPVQFTGKGSADLAAKDKTDVTGAANYDQGEWSAIFRRPLRTEGSAPFSQGEFLPVAFSVWDGFSRERGNRRALTVWYSLYVEPENVPSAIGPMVRTALFILLLELAVVGYVRWRYGTRARGEAGPPTQPAATRA